MTAVLLPSTAPLATAPQATNAQPPARSGRSATSSTGPGPRRRREGRTGPELRVARRSESRRRPCRAAPRKQQLGQYRPSFFCGSAVSQVPGCDHRGRASRPGRRTGTPSSSSASRGRRLHRACGRAAHLRPDDRQEHDSPDTRLTHTSRAGVETSAHRHLRCHDARTAPRQPECTALDDGQRPERCFPRRAPSTCASPDAADLESLGPAVSVVRGPAAVHASRSVRPSARRGSSR
jgi:hypothetical protein